MDVNKVLFGEDDKRVLKDSGSRREFESGAVRDASEGKGRCDLLPLDVVSNLLSAGNLERVGELYLIEEFKRNKDTYYLTQAILAFSVRTNINVPTLILEVSKQFEDGAKKYTENNWKKGIPLHCYIDSAVRHFLKFLRGDTDEPHDRAFIWNLLCACWTYENKPELDDIEIELYPRQEDLITEEKYKKTLQSVSCHYPKP